MWRRTLQTGIKHNIYKQLGAITQFNLPSKTGTCTRRIYLTLEHIINPLSLKLRTIFEADQLALAVLGVVLVLADVDVIVLVEHAAVHKVSVFVPALEHVTSAVGLLPDAVSLVVHVLAYRTKRKECGLREYILLRK